MSAKALQRHAPFACHALPPGRGSRMNRGTSQDGQCQHWKLARGVEEGEGAPTDTSYVLALGPYELERKMCDLSQEDPS